MTTEQQQSDREFERQVAYNNYVALSKTASKLLLFLLSFAAYLMFAAVERRQRLEIEEGVWWQEIDGEVIRISWEILELERTLADSPSNSDAFSEVLDSTGFTHRADSVLRARHAIYRRQLDSLVEIRNHGKQVDTDRDANALVEFNLPVVDIEVSALAFFLIGPAAFFVLSLWYWIFLSKSRWAHADFVRLRSTSTVSTLSQHPWLYTIRSKWPTINMLWQCGLELFPVVLLATLLVTLVESGSYFDSRIVLIVILSVLMLLCHAMLFRIFERVQSLILTLMYGSLVTAIILDILEVYHLKAFDFDGPFDIIRLWIYGFVFGVFAELLVLGKPWMSFILISPAVVPTMGVVALIQAVRNRSLRKGRERFRRSWNEFVRLSWGGYVSYFRHRYYELKDLDRLS